MALREQESQETLSYFGQCRSCLNVYLKYTWEKEMIDGKAVQGKSKTESENPDEDNLCNTCILKLEDTVNVKSEVIQSEQELSQECEAEDSNENKGHFKCIQEKEQKPIINNEEYPSPRNSSQQITTDTGEPDACKYSVYKCEADALNVQTKGKKPFECNLCDYKCLLRYKLKLHLRIHTGEKRLQCHLCAYKCFGKNDLKTHIRTHTGEKPYECNLCDYKCAKKCTLNSHLRIHTGEKPFECTMCDYKTKQKGTLNAHIKIHTGEKPFQCNICDYKTIWKGNLTEHIRTHTGETPYKCKMCHFKTKQVGSLKSHMRTHRGEAI